VLTPGATDGEAGRLGALGDGAVTLLGALDRTGEGGLVVASPQPPATRAATTSAARAEIDRMAIHSFEDGGEMPDWRRRLRG
jgi:hypothetical protein